MDKRTARKRLKEERSRLEALLHTFELENIDETQGDSLSEVSLADQHPADVGTETFEREKDVSIRNQIEAELADIERSFHRLDDGTYGLCEACGRKIPDERLGAVPWTRFCVDDQAAAEREARIA
jgi:DnaK suppressor protein